jgi:hypothetical protein
VPVSDTRGGFGHFGRHYCAVPNRTHPGGEKEHIYVTAMPFLQSETRLGNTWRAIKIE